MDTRQSDQLYDRLKKLTPAGVSSPVRAYLPYPISAEKGEGCVMFDVDGNRYVDLCMAYGPLIHGHSFRPVNDAVREQIVKGTVFGTPSIPECQLLDEIVSRVPCADSARLTNSGTEATMHAIRLARGFTGRNGIVKIDGGFHGSHNDVLVNGLGKEKKPFSKGIPDGAVENTYTVPYNDADELCQLIESNDDIAGIIMEPIPGNMGVIEPKKGYLEEVRRITKENGVVLIFDEVITGFRVSKGGAQELTGVVPDLCTMGKIIGGGFPIGAFAGKREIMENLAPAGPVYEAGTFSGNPVSAVAGVATLKHLDDADYRALAKMTDGIIKSMRDSLSDRNIAGCVNSAPSMFQVFFGIDSVDDRTDAKKADPKIFNKLFRYMLEHGFYLPPSHMEVEFLSTAHDDKAADDFCGLFDSFLREGMC